MLDTEGRIALDYAVAKVPETFLVAPDGTVVYKIVSSVTRVGLDRLIASGERAAELALRFKYGGMAPSAIEVVPDLEEALDRGLELTDPGGELVCLPTYTAMLGLQAIVTERGHARPYWERAA